MTIPKIDGQFVDNIVDMAKLGMSTYNIVRHIDLQRAKRSLRRQAIKIECNHRDVAEKISADIINYRLDNPKLEW